MFSGEETGMNCRLMGSFNGSDQSTTLRMWGDKRIAMGAFLIPSTTRPMKPSRVAMPVIRSLLSMSLCGGIVAGNTAERNSRRAADPWTVFVIYSSEVWR